MRVTLEKLQELCHSVDNGKIAEHLLRLDDSYFEKFKPQAIAQHIDSLVKLNPSHPLELQVETLPDGRIDCTVLSFNYNSVFSAITGVLSGTGFTIHSGDVFTYSSRPAKETDRNRDMKRSSQGINNRRKIIDYFSGFLDESVPFMLWVPRFRSYLEKVIGLFESGENQDIASAKRIVNELVANRLTSEIDRFHPKLLPVTIEASGLNEKTVRLKVTAEDSYAFLFSLSNTLSLQNFSIEHVAIRTSAKKVEDEIDISDLSGRDVTSQRIDEMKLTVLLTKQFTLFLSGSPSPYNALERFEHLIKDLIATHKHREWINLLSNPVLLRDLSHLLGTSDFLWEDFIRVQYEELLPLLSPQVRGHTFAGASESIGERLENTLKEASTIEEQQKLLNEFKDREIFLIDLEYILGKKDDFRAFSHYLTTLAEHVIVKASDCVYQSLCNRYGQPQTVAGIPALYAIFGLGKMGGSALGYASDIELLFVYNDNGNTGGPSVIENSEFFNLLVRNISQFIKAKREGIFTLDLRLRPYGESGPLACSLESFCRYYGPGGNAHSFERLSLVRLRAIGGDPVLGSRIERLRDEFIYASNNIRLQELRELREKQFREKVPGGTLNAKFSPGALVDLEYTVQILQIMYGKDNMSLRTPAIHKALVALSDVKVLDANEAKNIDEAYSFLRRLINGLRMLRGSAGDLFLPSETSKEFSHLARRIGYEPLNSIDPSKALRLDFDSHTARIRAFVEKHLGRQSLPGPATGNIADLILSDFLPPELRARILQNASFRNPDRAFTNLRKLSGYPERKEDFTRLAVLACDILKSKPDADMALNNWERLTGSVKDITSHYRLLLSQPTRLDILMGILSGSQFLADTLISNPEFFDFVTTPENTDHDFTREELLAQINIDNGIAKTDHQWLDWLRRFRRREFLRIGTRDICLHLPTYKIMNDLSTLADALIEASLQRGKMELAQYLSDQTPFCIFAMGKLGGRELNYSSDIDLTGLYQSSNGVPSDEIFEKLMEKSADNLSRHTPEGYIYRVDLRLRPYGSSGKLACSFTELERYYRTSASLWEIQALLKIRPVAGDLVLGQKFLETIRTLFLRKFDPATVISTIKAMRDTAVKNTKGPLQKGVNIKNGIGGIRDVEFLVQGLQLISAEKHPSVLTGNTIEALKLLAGEGILDEHAAGEIRQDYLFLRRTEHFLQIFEDRQIHCIPHDPLQITALAKRLLGNDTTPQYFILQLEDCMKRVRKSFEEFLLNGKYAI